MKKIKLGQQWSFKNSLNESAYLKIQKIQYLDNDCVVHISIYKLGSKYDEITHLPVECNVLMHSLKEEIGLIDADFDQEFEEAYQVWEKEDGGIWSISVSEIIKICLEDNL